MQRTFFERLTRVKNEKELPIIPIKNIVLFPNIVTTLIIQGGAAKAAAEEALKSNKQAVIIAQKNPEIDSPKKDDIFRTGVLIYLAKESTLPNGTLVLVIETKSKAKLKGITQEEPFLKADIQEVKEFPPINSETTALFRAIVDLFKQTVNLGKNVPIETIMATLDLTDPVKAIDIISSSLELPVKEKQNLLETLDFKERLEKLNRVLAKEVAILQEAQKIQTRTAEELGKAQKEVFLREELKAIQKELGMEEREDITGFRKKIDNASLSSSAKEIAERELEKLKKTPSFSPEIGWITGYLHTLTSLPWTNKSKDRLDLRRAREILDEDHYGLEKVKERILE